MTQPSASGLESQHPTPVNEVTGGKRMPDREHDTLSIRETAKRVGRSHQVLYKAAKEAGEVLPGVRVFKIGSSMRVSRIQLDEFLGRQHEHLFGYSPRLMEPMSPEGLEQLRRSVVMLAPGDRSGLDRETALGLLEEVQRLKESDRRHTELVEALRRLLVVAERPY